MFKESYNARNIKQEQDKFALKYNQFETIFPEIIRESMLTNLYKKKYCKYQPIFTYCY